MTQTDRGEPRVAGLSNRLVSASRLAWAVVALTAAAVAWLLLGQGGPAGIVLSPMRGVTVLVAGISVLLLAGWRRDDQD